MVIVVPAVLLAMTMVFQAMEYFWARQAAETAARQAVDSARVYGAGDGAGAAQANSVLTQLGSPLHGVSVSVSRSNGVVTAHIAGHPDQLIPGVVLTVSVTADGPAETFTAAP